MEDRRLQQDRRLPGPAVLSGPGETYLEFPYDWRRDNRVAAHRLAASAREWLDRARTVHPDAKLVLLGHSMGGLVARYYLEVLGGWRDTRRLITFGTPYRGSLNAVDFVANGIRKAFGLVDLTDLCARSHPCTNCCRSTLASIPATGRCRASRKSPNALPRLTSERLAAARGFHREIEDAVARHGDDATYRDGAYRLRPVIGIEQPTYQSAVEALGAGCSDLPGQGSRRRRHRAARRGLATGGDVGRRRDVLVDKHASLQNADGVQTQVRGWLNDLDLGGFLDVAPARVAVDTADIHRAGDPVQVIVTPSAPTAGLAASLSWVGGPGTPAAPTASAALPGGRRRGRGGASGCPPVSTGCRCPALPSKR